mgnify:FL=1
MNYSAKLRLYFHICKRFRGKVLDFWGLIGKNLRRLREVLLVPQISQMHTDFTDVHRFFCVVLMFQVTQISQISQIFYLFTLLNFHTDFTDLTDFLLFHFFTFLPLKGV